MVAGPRTKMRPGLSVQTAMAVHRMARPATDAKAALTPAQVEKPFRGFTVRFGRRLRVRFARRGLADGRNLRRGRDLGLGHFGLEQVAAARDDPDHLALVVTEGGADFADALEQAVLADMDVRPDGFHQLLLAEDTAGIGGEQPQHLQRLGPQLDRLAIGPAQLGALGIELKTRKAQHPSPSNRQLSPFGARIDLKNVPDAQSRRISEKFQNVSTAVSGHRRPTMR